MTKRDGRLPELEATVNDQTLILIGAFGGAVVGVLGGVVGTYFTIRNTHGPRERAFVIRGSLVCWLAILAFGAAMWVMPMPYRALLWLPYMFGLHLAVRFWNRKQSEIRRAEAVSANVP